MNDICRTPNPGYSASAGLGQGISVAFVGNNLSLRGAILDTVQRSYRIDISDETGIGFENISSDEILSLKELMEKLRWTDELSCVYEDDWAEPFCRTLCAGSTQLRDDIRVHAIILASSLDQGTWLRMRGNHSRKGYEDTMTYWNEVSAFCLGRSLVITEKGYYGLAPRLTQPGDKCCLLLGADVPFILRPHGTETSFRLLGEAYVHGIMEGQVKGMLKQGALTEETLVIC
jgi:hypothetical protein